MKFQAKSNLKGIACSSFWLFEQKTYTIAAAIDNWLRLNRPVFQAFTLEGK